MATGYYSDHYGEQVDKTVTEFLRLRDVTSLDGSDNSLKQVATQGVEVPYGGWILVDDVLSYYQLVEGTDEESLPTIVVPDDYMAVTNEKVWKLKYVAGGIGPALYTFGTSTDDTPPLDGTVLTQGWWNLDTGHHWINTNWPDYTDPTWESA